MSIMDSIEKGFSRVNSATFKRVNRARDWWDLPKPLALLNLRAYRDDMRQANLYDTREDGQAEPTPLKSASASIPRERQALARTKVARRGPRCVLRRRHIVVTRLLADRWLLRDLRA